MTGLDITENIDHDVVDLKKEAACIARMLRWTSYEAANVLQVSNIAADLANIARLLEERFGVRSDDCLSEIVAAEESRFQLDQIG